MSTFNYYKDKYDLVKVFCIVFEHDGHFTKAAEAMQTGRQAISAKMKTLEEDMKCTFFVQNGSIMVPTKKAEEFYLEAKKFITDFESLYKAKQGIADEVQIITNADRVFNTVENAVDNISGAVGSKIEEIQIVLDSQNQKQQEVTEKLETTFKKMSYVLGSKSKIKKSYIFGAIFIAIASFYIYLNKTNYFFDRELYANASLKLKSIIKNEYYNISDHEPCSFSVMQMNIDMYDLIDNLTKKNKYKDLNVILFMTNSEPLISMRFSGIKEIDDKINMHKLITCNFEKSYTESLKLFKKTEELFKRDKNFKIYNFYYRPIKDCLYCDNFVKNVEKYPNNLFSIKTPKQNTQNNRGWIIKYGYYYYILDILNISFNEEKIYEQHVVWKKIHENEFMNYSRGKYFNMFDKNYITL